MISLEAAQNYLQLLDGGCARLFKLMTGASDTESFNCWNMMALCHGEKEPGWLYFNLFMIISLTTITQGLLNIEYKANHGIMN